MTNDGSPQPQPTAPAPAVEVPAPSKGSRIQRWLVPALALVAALAIGFLGGVLVGQNTAQTSRVAFGGGAPGGGQGQNLPDGLGQRGFGANGAGGFTSGKVVSVSGDTVVIETSDGKQVTVKADDGTTVTITKDGSVGDLKAGDEVTAIGETESDGSISANTITEGRSGAFPGFGGAPGANGGRPGAGG